MSLISFSEKEIDVLRILLDSQMSITEISHYIGKSISRTSRCVTNLERIGVIEKIGKGSTRIIKLNENEMGEAVSLLIRENELLNLKEILSNSKLDILILLLPPGSTIKEIQAHTNLSKSSIDQSIRKWKNMGIVYKKENNYLINTKQRTLKKFMWKIAKRKNQMILEENNIEGLIIWQRRDEFIFSVMDEISNLNFFKASLSRLSELGFDIIHNNNYYYYSPIGSEITIEEAIIQSVKIDPNNPRFEKIIRTMIKKREIDTGTLFIYGDKYRIKSKIKGMVY